MSKRQAVGFQSQYNQHLTYAETEIVGKYESKKMDFNTLAVEAYQGFENLGEPIIGLPSDVTGTRPAEGVYIYRTQEVDIRLTREELIRICNRSLTPNEWEALHEVFGPIFELHDDYYDEVGLALQPRG